jgi:hypothetical protein
VENEKLQSIVVQRSASAASVVHASSAMHAGNAVHASNVVDDLDGERRPLSTLSDNRWKHI